MGKEARVLFFTAWSTVLFCYSFGLSFAEDSSLLLQQTLFVTDLDGKAIQSIPTLYTNRAGTVDQLVFIKELLET